MAAERPAENRQIVIDLKSCETCNEHRPQDVPQNAPYEDHRGAGLSRSGTSCTSFCTALVEEDEFDREQLCDKLFSTLVTIHMTSVFNEDPRDAEMWVEVVAAKYTGKARPFIKDDWDQLLGYCMYPFPLFLRKQANCKSSGTR
jgi:hypothetical protein